MKVGVYVVFVWLIHHDNKKMALTAAMKKVLSPSSDRMIMMSDEKKASPKSNL